MKRRNKNRPSPFPDFQTGCRKRRLNLALVFLCLFSVILVFWYFVCILVFWGYCYFMLSVPVQLTAWEDRPRNDLLRVKGNVKQLPTYSLNPWFHVKTKLF